MCRPWRSALRLLPHWSLVDWIANRALTVALIGVLLIIFMRWLR